MPNQQNSEFDCHSVEIFSERDLERRRDTRSWVDGGLVGHFCSLRAVAKGNIGFTLLELLVVIAIILVLAAMVFPAVKGIQARANMTKCANNMRQQFAGAMAYAADTGVLPRSVDSGVYFFREVAPYLGYDYLTPPPTRTAKDYPVFMCPERSVDDLIKIVAANGGSISYGGYVYNPSVCGIPPNSLPVKRLSQFSKPSKVWMIADGNAQASPYAWDTTTIERRIAYDHVIGQSHMAQLLMLDGHAEFKTVEEMKANAGNFWAVPYLGDPQ